MGLFAWLLVAAIGAGAQNTLISVKKGNRGDKSWAVFTFDKKAILIGVFQPDMGKLSLYLWGESGMLNGSVITLDQAYDRSILIKQARPSIIRADILNAAPGPMSVLKKDGYLVVAFNDERLLDGSTLLYGEGIGIPGKMTGLTSSTEGNKTTAFIPFEGAFDWIGYVRSSPETASLFIRGADLADGRNDLNFDQGAFHSIRLMGIQGETSGIKAEVMVTQNTPIQIARKTSKMIVQVSSAQAESDTSDAISQLASAEAEKPKPLRPAVETSIESAQPVEAKALPPPAGETETKPGEETIPWDKLVSFTFRNTPVRDALQLVASSNSLNMVITEGVRGAVTMELKNVTLRQAMDKIINTQKCEYTVDGSIITVKPVEAKYAGGRVTKVYRLKYADAVNVAKVIKRIATSDSLVDAFRPEFLDFSEAGKNRMASNTQTVQGIRRSSVLVVTDRPEKIQEIDQVIRDLDKPPAQIFIESKMVEMSPENSNKLGIDWNQSFDLAYSALPGGNKTLDLLNTGGGLQINREWQTGQLTKNQYATLLNFLQEKTDAKLILNPKINAMDNEEAIISIGQTVPVASIQRGTGGQGDMVTFSYREVSIRLNVTPHVLGNGEITMYINPVIEEITEWRTLYGSEAPVTDKRSVNSIITVRNGETIVIGGLIRNQRKKTLKKVWLLGNLPLFGRLFQYETEIEKQTDLMIFITPNIVES
jgi:type IV pilus secretin PilQ/predicted competence protein